MCLSGFQSHHLLATALSSRLWGALFPASMQWFRKTCAMSQWVMVGSRDAQSQNNDFSLCPSEKQKSVTQHSWPQFSSKHPSWICTWLGRSLHSSISSALSSLGQLPSGPHFCYSRPCGVLSLQTLWLPPYTPDLMVEPHVSGTHSGPLLFMVDYHLHSFSAPSFKCSAQNSMHDLISSPSYDVFEFAIFAIPVYILPPFSCHL